MQDLPGLALFLGIVLVAGAGYFMYTDLKKRNAMLHQQLVAQQHATREAQQTLNETQEAMDEATRKKVHTIMRRSRPLKNPPAGITPTIQRMLVDPLAVQDPYMIAFGWEETRGNPDVVKASLANDSPYRTGNIILSGEPGAGKGTLAFLILATLARRTTTAQYQHFIIDPKVVEGNLWLDKSHNWRSPVLGKDTKALEAAMTAITEERQRRERMRAEHRVLEFEQLPPAARPPMLLIYISELDALEAATDDLEGWLNEELSIGRASGMRFLIDSQVLNNREARWRNYVMTFIAGMQSRRDTVKPNIEMTIEELREKGAVPPHELPGWGYFTVRSGRDAMTVHVPNITVADREALLAQLPDTAMTMPVLDEVQAVTEQREVVATTRKDREVVVSPEEWESITQTARAIAVEGTGQGRNEVVRRVFGGSPSGDASRKVKLVCDKEGLLLPKVRGMDIRPPTSVEVVEAA